MVEKLFPKPTPKFFEEQTVKELAAQVKKPIFDLLKYMKRLAQWATEEARNKLHVPTDFNMSDLTQLPQYANYIENNLPSYTWGLMRDLIDPEDWLSLPKLCKLFNWNVSDLTDQQKEALNRVVGDENIGIKKINGEGPVIFWKKRVAEDEDVEMEYL